MNDLSEYYSKRAKEYEGIYHRDDPVRQSEQNEIAAAIKEVFKDLRVLEVACGTGFWTTFLSEVAKNITAIDISDEVLAIARSKKYQCVVNFQNADAYKLPFERNTIDGGMANFWFSHVPKEKTEFFLDEFYRVLTANAPIFMADNVFNKGVGGELVKKQGDVNTYKMRNLENGEKYEVLKNYYTESQLKDIFGKYKRVEIFYGTCFWFVKYIM
jgi:ubiquinone/menaquinone biosynthesis C-methylase UbiE